MFSDQILRIKSPRALMAGLFALGLLSGCATLGPGQKCASADCNADGRVASAVQSSLDRHPEFGPSGQVQVETFNHVVYLYGSVANDFQLAVAKSVAAEAGGDARLVSSIAVSEK
jgi:osmotically-inducible protein OsmY